MLVNEKQDRHLAEALEKLACSVSALADQLGSQNGIQTVLARISQLEEVMAIKVSEIKTAIAAAAKNSKEAFGELSAKIADLNQQIKDLIEGVGDPTVTDEAFEADLKSLGTDSQALADIVSTVVPPPTT